MTHILIDGYNFIRRSPQLSQIDAQNLEAGRRALVMRLKPYLEAVGHRITVVFDAAQREFSTDHEERMEGIRLRFTASGQSADDLLIQMAGQLRDQCIVVSSDREILHAAGKAGCGLLSSEEFERKLQEAGRPFTALFKDGPAPPKPLHKRWLTKKKGPAKRLPKAKRRALAWL